MNIEPIEVVDWVRWGKLVKSWATGRSYFEHDTVPIGIEKLPIPRSLQELKEQIELVQARVTIPDSIRGLSIMQHSADTMVIKLPPKERLENREEALSSGGGEYPFPSFYHDFIDGGLATAQKLDAHACRIGDYTIQMCG